MRGRMGKVREGGGGMDVLRFVQILLSGDAAVLACWEPLAWRG